MDQLSQDQQAIEDSGLLDKSGVICIPTGGGKTFLARRAIKKVLAKGLKAVYVPPLRAIARELSESWAQEFAGYRVGVYTGELGLDEQAESPSPSEADVLIMTPEKFDLYLRAWTEHLAWLSKVDLLIVDELHTLGSGRRGATLEGLITRLKAVVPYARAMGLSATLGNPTELGTWLGGDAYISDSRPVPLAWRIRTHSKGGCKADLVIDEAKETLAEGRQAIVFVQSRPRTESLVKRLAEAGIEAVAHHAGMSRKTKDQAEEAYRTGRVRVIVATPTLAMGVNLPAAKVVLHDLQRWDGGGWVDLSTAEVWQLGGRAGRRGLDEKGEVVLIAPAWNQKSARRYIAGKFEPIESQVKTEQGFAEQLMVCFGSRLALKVEQAERVMAKSFMGVHAYPGALKKRVAESVEDMIRAGMLERSDEGYIRATRLGRIATRFQLTARTVINWRNMEDGMAEATLFDLLVVIAGSTDFTARVRVEHQEVSALQCAMQKEPMQLREMLPNEVRRVVGSTGKDLIGAVKTALMLRAWTRLGDLEEAGAAFGEDEHCVEEARKECVRLLQALVALLSARPRQVTEDGKCEGPGLIEKAKALGAMVCAGLDDEQATLALIDGVGPIMARRLAEGGFTDIEALGLAEVDDVARLDGISEKRAARWIDEAAAFAKTGGAMRYREVWNAGRTAPGEAKLAAGLDYFRWMRARDLSVEDTSIGWEVSGGSAAHMVQRSDSGRLSCDCEDHKRRLLCKHLIAVKSKLGEEGIPALSGDYPSVAGGTLNLEDEWGHSAWRASNYR